MAFFFMVVSLMQLAEYFMWKDLKCGNMNRYATKFAFIILVLEPLIALLGCYYFSVLTIDKKLLKKIILIYVVLGAYFLIKILGFSGNLCSKPFNSTGNSHLVWDLSPIISTIPKFIYYLFIILYFMAFFVFLFFKNKKQGISFTNWVDAQTHDTARYYSRRNFTYIFWYVGRKKTNPINECTN